MRPVVGEYLNQSNWAVFGFRNISVLYLMFTTESCTATFDEYSFQQLAYGEAIYSVSIDVLA